MKLLFAVIRDKDTNQAVASLTERRFGVTKLSSTGGFLRNGSTTLMIGTEDERVEEVIQLLKENCAKRSEMEIAAPYPTEGIPAWNVTYTPIKVEVGGATVFVLDVERLLKL